MPVRVLVVDDSATVRARLCEILRADPDLAVIGEAADGAEAIAKCRELGPDVITLDMILPVMSGVAATEYIMAHQPTPILIVSASLNRGDVYKTYDALAAGAVDVLDKPRGDDSDEAWARTFVARVKLVAKIKVITHPRARLAGYVKSDTIPPSPRGAAKARELVAIGASTGGPGAIVTILRAIPETFSLPIVFVLHVDEPFGAAFADWLDAQTPHRVAMARDGEPIAEPRVYLAPPGKHLVIAQRRAALTSDPPRHSCRPSIDTLFESVARDYGGAAMGVLLTGMGRDGAAGLLAMRRAGALAIAQDEATSIVYGMPREAAAIGAADRVLPVGAIGRAIADEDPRRSR